MLFAVGTKVRMKHTGDKGVVTEILGGGMLNVLLQFDDMEIPVFEEDVVKEEEYVASNSKHFIQQGKQVRAKNAPAPSKKIEYTIEKSLGVQLAFDPDYDREGMVKKYKIFLLNDTDYDYLFSIYLERAGTVPKSFNGKLDALSTYLVEELLYDSLNDNPSFTVDCWRMTTAGTEQKQTQTIKIKPKQFFKKVQVTPLLKRPVHLYVVFDPTKKPAETSKEEDLKAYTQKNVKPTKKRKADYVAYDPHDVREFANFVPEIDLHIENLSARTLKMSNAEMLRLQLQNFDTFIAKAIRLGVHRVFVIHGVGKGKLRNEIASRLIKMPGVKTFKNEYHPKYGWGATEVFF